MPIYSRDEMRDMVRHMLPKAGSNGTPVKKQDSTETLRIRQSLAEQARKHLEELARGSGSQGM